MDRTPTTGDIIRLNGDLYRVEAFGDCKPSGRIIPLEADERGERVPVFYESGHIGQFELVKTPLQIAGGGVPIYCDHQHHKPFEIPAKRVKDGSFVWLHFTTVSSAKRAVTNALFNREPRHYGDKCVPLYWAR